MIPERERKAQANTWILALTRRILTNIEEQIQSVRHRVEIETECSESTDSYLAEIAIGLSPDAFGLAHIYQRSPYTNPKSLQRRFSGAVQRGWLHEADAGVYQASERSREYYQRLCRQVDRVYRNLRPLPVMHLERIDAQLSEVIKAIEVHDAIAYRPAFDLDRRLAPMGASLLERICCKLSQISAYRDDAYLNAWMDQEVNSYVWEAFSHIYKGFATDAETLSVELGQHRGYAEPAYKDALAELTDRGWIAETPNGYEPSETGLKVLAEVACSMSHYFFAPWADFSDEFLNRLKYLLEALADALKPEKTRHWYGQAQIGRSYGWRSLQWAREKIE